MKKLFLICIVTLSCTTFVYAQQGMGVGNNNPQEMLDVSGAIKIGTDINNNTNAPAGGAGTLRFRSGQFEGWDGSEWVTLSGGGADTDWTASGSDQYSGVSGNVGIGTATPNFKLDVNGSARFNNGSFVNNGLASSPSISFSSDSNTGIYAPSADNLGFVTGGVEGFRVDENGNVGIGPANPDAKLDLVGTFRYTNGTQGVNKVLRSDGSGFATWVDPNTLISDDGDWTVSGNNQYSAVSGNVGIGLNNPTNKLHISGTGHTGTNINAGTGFNAYIDFAENGTNRSNIFWDGANDNLTINTSTDNTVINPNGGNVGIGTAAAQRKLHIESNVPSGLNIPLLIRNASATNNSNAGSGIGFNNHNGGTNPKTIIYSERISDFGLGKLHFALNNTADLSSVSLADARMTIQSNGNVGIGTTAPSSRLVVNGTMSIWNSEELRFFDGAGTNQRGTIGRINGTGDMIIASNTAGNWLRIGANNSNIAFFPNNDYSSNNDPTFIMTETGRLGVGTSAPIARIHAEGGIFSANFGARYYSVSGGNAYFTTNRTLSGYFQNDLACGELQVFSDARIKNIIGISNSKSDLETLMNIEITDYSFKDYKVNGRTEKKLIAQQVENIYPPAVSTGEGYIPNVYALCKAQFNASENLLKITLEENVEIVSGDKIKLIMESGNSKIVDVVSASEKTLSVGMTEFEGANVFVYGKHVDDFRTVDYDAVAMLNVSATQELFRMIKKLEDENASLKSSIEGFKVMAEEIEKLKQWTNCEQQSTK